MPGLFRSAGRITGKGSHPKKALKTSSSEKNRDPPETKWDQGHKLRMKTLKLIFFIFNNTKSNVDIV